MIIRSKVTSVLRKKGINAKVLLDAGLSSSTIARAKKSSKIAENSGIAECRLSTLVRIAMALDVSVKDLFDEEYCPPPMPESLRKIIEQKTL